MAEEIPKSMRKYHSNIFRRMGKKLEENLRLSSPNLFASIQASPSMNLSRTQSASYQAQSDTVSLQNYPPTIREENDVDQREEYHHTYSYPSRNMQIDDSSIRYDQEMKIICKDLLENRIRRITDFWDYDKKVSLLRIAMSYDIPKVTVPVILYLENSLTKPLFYDLIKQYPKAVDSYINLAKLNSNPNHYLAILKQFGKNDDIAMIHIRHANEQTNLTSKIVLLDQAANEFQSNPWWQSQILDYRRLLQKQRDIQRYLSSLQANTPLEHRTLLKTYTIVYGIVFQQEKYRRHHADKKITRYIDEFEKEFSMTLEMITCGKLTVIMKCSFRSNYDDFLQLTTYQGFLGRKYVISPENFADMVYNWIKSSGEGQQKASEEAGRFIKLISKPIERVFYAEKYQNYDIAIDTIVNVLHDRIQLEDLLRRIPHDHPSYNRAMHYLLENTKWRN